jgi:hypothetical protein
VECRRKSNGGGALRRISENGLGERSVDRSNFGAKRNGRNS